MRIFESRINGLRRKMMTGVALNEAFIIERLRHLKQFGGRLDTFGDSEMDKAVSNVTHDELAELFRALHH